jgi:roadblock/LC7 domain-containing protein
MVWGSLSSYVYFIRASGIASDFENNMNGWSAFKGGTWKNAHGYLYTSGKSNSMTSVKYTYKYDNLEMEAKVKREGGTVQSSYPANYMLVRMGTSSTSAAVGSYWYPGYMFGYTNAGTYAIFRMNSSGSMTTIQPWTKSDAIVKEDWNTLRVTAEGENFSFYINGTHGRFVYG